MPSGIVRRVDCLGRLGALSVPGGSCDDVLHFLMIGKPAEFDACLLRSWKKHGLLKS